MPRTVCLLWSVCFTHCISFGATNKCIDSYVKFETFLGVVQFQSPRPLAKELALTPALSSTQTSAILNFGHQVCILVILGLPCRCQFASRRPCPFMAKQPQWQCLAGKTTVGSIVNRHGKDSPVAQPILDTPL